MELNLDVEKIGFLKPLFRGCTAEEEVTEVIVPDLLPDALRIVSAAGTALLRGKDVTETGFSVAGIVECAVIYASEDGDVRKIDVSLPFVRMFEAEDVSEDDFLTASVTVQKIAVGILNPRKLSVKAEVQVCAEAYGKGEIEAYNCVTDSDSGAEVLQKTLTAEIPASVNEKTFTVTDEIAVTAPKPDVREILSVCSRIYGDEIKGVGTKVVARGRIITDVTYISEAGSVEAEKFTSQFSQIVETDVMCEDNYSSASFAVTDVYVSRGIPNGDGDTVLRAEISAVVQCVTYKTADVSYIADAYSTRHPMNVCRGEIILPRVTGRFSMTKTMVASIETEGRARDVLYVNIVSGGASVHGGRIMADMGISVMYLAENGELVSAYKQVTAETELDLDPGTAARGKVEWEGEAFINAMGGGMEVRFPVRFTAVLTDSEAIDAVTAMTCETETLLDTGDVPSLTVYRTRGRDDLWELGKKFCSTGEMILAANGLEGSAPLPPGIMLIIPKKR